MFCHFEFVLYKRDKSYNKGIIPKKQLKHTLNELQTVRILTVHSYVWFFFYSGDVLPTFCVMCSNRTSDRCQRPYTYTYTTFFNTFTFRTKKALDYKD